MTEADMYTARIATFILAAFLWQPVAHADLDDIRRIAEAGDREAQLELGILFQYGFNYKDNEIPALTWYSLSANQGNVRAQKLRDDGAGRLVQTQGHAACRRTSTGSGPSARTGAAGAGDTARAHTGRHVRDRAGTAGDTITKPGSLLR